jgi:Bacterial PH domain
MLALVVVPCVLVVVILGASILGSQRARFELSAAGLELHGDLYGRTIPRGSIVGADVRIVDLEREAALKPTRRTWGTAIPGYRAGWFRLAGGQKALLYVTDLSRVVYVPTTLGYVVLLSPSDPDALTARLRDLARR